MSHDPRPLRGAATATGTLAVLVATAGLACAAAPGSKAASTDSGARKIAKIEASDTMPRFRHYRFDAANVGDGDPKTCWQPKAKDPFGRWLRLTLTEEAEVTGLTIHNGFQLKDALGDLFALNSRLTRAWVVFDRGAGELISLSPSVRGAQSVRFARPHRTRTVTLVVREVEDGDKWHHLALSEVAVEGRPVTTAAPADGGGDGPCADPRWSAVQRGLISECGPSCTPAHYDAVLLCRDPRTGRAIVPVHAELGEERISVQLDGDAELLLELSRGEGGAWEVDELMTGDEGDN